MKVYITDTAQIGRKCQAWAIDNMPQGFELTTDESESDFFFSVFYNRLLSAGFIAGRKKCFNFHGGILPDYKGSGTLNWAILNKEKQAGITLHEIDEKIDHGDIIAIETFAIDEHDTTADLFARADYTIFKMFTQWFERLLIGHYTATVQDRMKGKLYTRKDLQDARDITHIARAFHTPPYEQAYYYNKDGKKIFLEWE